MLRLFFILLVKAGLCYEPWQIPPGVEVNIKPLGHEVGSSLQWKDLWMSSQVLAEVDSNNVDKIADIKYLTKFTET